MNLNQDKLRELTKDLRKEEPRSAYEKLGGFEAAARCLDKCRASLIGWQGDFKYGCPMDREFLDDAGLDQDEFRNFVATGASDDEVDLWIRQRSHARAKLRGTIWEKLMKSPLEEAEALFRENEMLFGDVKQDKEKANLYRGLARLAQGLSQLEERMERLEMERVGTHVRGSD